MLNPDHLYLYLAIIVLTGAVICVLILRKQKEQREAAEKKAGTVKKTVTNTGTKNEQSNVETIDLKKTLTAEELRLLATDLGVIADKVHDPKEIMTVSLLKSLVGSSGEIPKSSLYLCVAATQSVVDGMASTFGLSLGGHNDLLEKLKKLQEEEKA